MVRPEDYAAAVRSAALDGEGEAHDRAPELAGVCHAYEELLGAEDALDLGDLVARPARLLEENDDVARHYGACFSHVLVNEFQDVTTASARLLQSLCGPEERARVLCPMSAICTCHHVDRHARHFQPRPSLEQTSLVGASHRVVLQQRHPSVDKASYTGNRAG